MSLSRRAFLAATAAAALVGCRRSPRSPNEPQDTGTSPSDARLVALMRAANFLKSKQSPDGAWRSEHYGPFKFGDALTPLCLLACQKTPKHFSSNIEPPADPCCEKAADFLAGFARKSGQIEEPELGFEFTTYTAALAVVTLGGMGTHRLPARDAWLKYLRERQLTASLGWKPDDREFGGWGYCRVQPKKPKPGELVVPLLESNLSATTFALSALRTAGATRHDPAFIDASRFVRHCQNWSAAKESRDPSFDDGGFHFIYGDPVRNKAGMAGIDRFDRERFHSYGSATADGIRALELCGHTNSPEYRAAEAWMRRNFRCNRHPGRYGESREMDREAVFYYWAASLAQTRVPSWTVRVGMREMSWKQALAEELLTRQRPDGSWANRAHAVREDDPLNATSLAMIALSHLDG